MRRSLFTGRWRLGDLGGKVYILGGDSIGHCDKKKVYMNLCLIVNCYWDKAVWIYKYKSIVNDDKER
jgi:hypothetical protein